MHSLIVQFCSLIITSVTSGKRTMAIYNWLALNKHSKSVNSGQLTLPKLSNYFVEYIDSIEIDHTAPETGKDERKPKKTKKQEERRPQSCSFIPNQKPNYYYYYF